MDIKNIGNKIGEAGTVVAKQAENALDVIRKIEPEEVLNAAMKAPFVKIDREKFLRKELIKYYPEDVVELAIKKNPAYAGIERWSVGKIAENVIDYETNKVTAISAAAGIPGGVAMLATVPADVTQYFAFLIRVMQQIAYLYGFEEFDFDEDHVSAETMNTMLICLGVMFGVQGANAAVTKLSNAMALKVAKDIMKKPLTKGTVYPTIKKISCALGIKMTKQVFADGASKVIPIIGAAASGGITYMTFKPSSYRLQNEFKSLNISDPQFYKSDIEIDYSSALDF